MENSSLFPSSYTSYTAIEPNRPTEDTALDMPLVVILCTVLGVASVLGSLGNILVMLSIIKFDNLREIPDLFIFSLSLSDLLVTSLFQPLKASRLARFEDDSTVRDFLKISSSFLGHFSLIASISNMFGVTVERLISIRFPLKYDIFVTKRRAIFTVICIWIFSIAYGGVWSQGLAPESYLAIYFIAILIGTVSIYVYIFLVARRLEESVAQVRSDSAMEEQRFNSRREKKAAKTIAVILGVAIVCWVPFLIIPQALGKDQDQARFLKVFNSLQVLSVCNSSINPYIYCARSRRYYVALVKLLGMHKTLSKRVQAAATPRYSTRDPMRNAHQAFQEIQPSKGEIYDAAL